MSTLHVRFRSSAWVLALLVLCLGCGGGGAVSGSPGGGNPASSRLVLTSGDGQAGIGGMLMPKPIYVTVLDPTGAPVGGSTVTFSSVAGVDLLPTSVTTSKTGVAGAWVRLPAVANTKFAVQANASTGGSVTFNLTTGARLAASFGDATTGCGAVAADGSYYSGVGQFTVGSPAVFNADGTLRSKFLPTPGPGKGPVETGNLLFITPNQKLYTGMATLDLGLGLLQTTDFAARNGANTSSQVNWTNGNLAADTDGVMYGIGANLYVYDTWGTVTGIVGYVPGLTRGAVGTTKGHVVILTYDTGDSYTLWEYDRQGVVVRSQPVPQGLSSFLKLSIGSDGNIYLYNGSGTLYTYDSNLQLVRTTLIPYYPKGFAGVNAAGDLYVCDEVGNDGYSLLSNSGVFKYSVGPGGLNGPPITTPTYQPVFTKPAAASADPATGMIYFLDHSAIHRFLNNSYVGSWSDGNDQWATGIAHSPSGEIYRFSVYLNSPVDVVNSSGAVVRSIADNHFDSLVGMAIDSSQNKYIVDLQRLPFAPVIHVLDASDRYVAGIPINFLSQTRGARVQIAPDGNLIVAVYSDAGEGYVKKLRASDGAEIWSRNYPSSAYDPVTDIALDSTGRIYALRSLMDVLDGAGNLVSTFTVAFDGARPRSSTPMVSVGNTIYFYDHGTVYGLILEP
jgi:hypothetical protein